MTFSKKIVYSAIAAALIVLANLAGYFSTFSELMFVGSFCIVIVFDKCGKLFGFLSYLAGGLLTALIAWQYSLLFFALFGLYGILFHFLDLVPKKHKPIEKLVRYAVLLVFFNGVLVASYFLARQLFFDYEMLSWGVWGMVLLFALLNAFFVVLDNFFLLVRPRLYKLLK